MPWDEVLSKYKRGALNRPNGKQVTNRKEAIAIMLSEKKKAQAGNREYQSRKVQ